MSDLIPNSFQTPNAYVDRFMYMLTPEEWKVLSYAARKIFGFQKRQDRISQSQFMYGTVSKKDGHQLDRGTGLSKPAVIRALEGLIKYGVLIKIADNDMRLNNGTLYELQLDADQINVEGLIERANTSNKSALNRTQKAREKASQSVGLTSRETTEVVSGTDQGWSVGLTGGGQSDRPGVVSGTDTQNQVKPISNKEVWMNDDPVCKFLRALPGYNPIGIEADRRKIISGKYDIEELAYLWADAQDKSTVNPIGLFLMMCDSGQHSAAYIEAKADQRDRAEQGADAQDAVTRFEKSAVPDRTVVRHPDWDAVLQELRSMWNGQFKSINPRLVAIDENPNTFTVLVNRATPHMAGDFERMLRGIAPKRQWTVKLVTESEP